MTDPCADNLGFFFAEVAKKAPDRIALIDLIDGERRRTYAALDSRCDGVAALAGSLGLRPGDRAALALGNRIEFVEVFFGLMRAGVVPVPLNVRQSADSLSFMMADADCRGAFVDPDAAKDAVIAVDQLNMPARVSLGPLPGWIDFETGLATSAAGTPAISPDGIAFQPYTAGSTGLPKGVRLTHTGMLWSIRTTQARWPVSPSEVGLVAVPLFHKNAMRGTIKPMLYAGGCAVILPRFEPASFLHALATYAVSFSGGVPAIFSMLLQHPQLIESYKYPALQYFSLGSAVVPPELIAEIERAFPGVSVKESYGLTEGGGPLRVPTDGGKVPRGSAGVAAEGYEVKLVDPDTGTPARRGELWTRSPCVTDGYHKLPDLTRERVIDGWLRTGDVFEVDDNGFYFFLGRTDDMFSCGGENIYPKEVENLILTHPAVRDAYCTSVAHAVKGLAPGVIVVAKQGATVTPDDIRRYALANGPAYAHPRVVLIADALPLSGAGKVDRQKAHALLDAAAESRT